ncbi:GNAT family N-acetyltransferase [Leucobacter luti]|uniref:N-acetylglutamate synthase-like GNAT family acetyltransferase n=1 Tax=Leucobacter luti TaxID=340320 RepID=A0A4Q7TNY2_9MICO|nr:GNAT family N-acetyltransferase [Leucobacter luti]MBL3700254.1 N-acetyltransferase [Leucobacter luti]RZT61022.1 N-acetylglutamate synthase-like GNAT family acetyltransferase [Leucobacter luti]
MSIIIRRGKSEDGRAVLALARQFTTGRETIGSDEFLVAYDNILRHRDQETNVLFVAERADKVVGYSLMTVSRLLHAPGLTAHLQEIVVDEASRGHGVGDRLMQANEHYCMGRGVRQLSASTARIGSFYNHRGFEPVGEHYRKILELG